MTKPRGFCLYALRGRLSGDVQGLLYSFIALDDEHKDDIHVRGYQKLMRPRPDHERERVEVTTISYSDWAFLHEGGVPTFRVGLDFYDIFENRGTVQNVRVRKIVTYLEPVTEPPYA